jgi:hypothetical protein
MHVLLGTGAITHIKLINYGEREENGNWEIEFGVIRVCLLMVTANLPISTF